MRVRQEFEACHRSIKSAEYNVQDSIILNLQRACENSIDISNQLIREFKLGLPKTSRESIEILLTQKVISEVLAGTLIQMIGFRNIAVHDYQNLNMDIVQAIVEKHLDDFEQYISQVQRYLIKAIE